MADLLSAAGGRVGEEGDPSQVFGSRSLRLREEIGSISDLLGVAGDAVRDYRAKDYKDDFSFVDHIVPVDDQDLEGQLRARLYDDVVAVRENIDVLWPDDLVPFEDERSICFIVRPRARADGASALPSRQIWLRPWCATKGQPG